MAYAPPSESIVDTIDDLATRYSLCRNRLWVSAQSSEPERRGDMLDILSSVRVDQTGSHHGHEQCTFDFCEYSRLDFTSVSQRHECESSRCDKLVYGEDANGVLEKALHARKLTAWSLREDPGKALVDRPTRYMAISHVWSDGTGSGGGGDVHVNSCLYEFWKRVGKRFQCDGFWWDTICIPREKAARSKAILRMQGNYEYACITFVHDLFIRSWEWVNGEVACLAIILSPWFSRGWTALELACSRKVKVMFKGGMIKDLDEDILAKDDSSSPRHKFISQIIQALRVRNVDRLTHLLRALSPRYTSWPRDVAIISGQLTGVSIKRKDTQQDIYQSVLRKIGRIPYECLFHNSVTMMKQFTWCPASLFNMPLTSASAPLFVDAKGTVIGIWDTFPVAHIPAEALRQCSWRGIHPLVEAKVKSALKCPDDHVLLSKPGQDPVCSALVAKVLMKDEASVVMTVSFVGPVYPNPPFARLDTAHPADTFDVCILSAGKHESVKQVDTKGDTGLLSAAEFGYTENIETILSQSPELANTATDEDGNTGLHVAARSGHLGAVESLLKYIAADLANSVGETALMLAAQNGHCTVASVLLYASSDPNIQDASTWTSLHHGTWGCHSNLIEDLLQAQAASSQEINLHFDKQDRLGQAPLHLAAARANIAIVRSLLKRGADTSLKCEDGQTVLHRAAWGGSAAVVEELLTASPGCKNMIDEGDANGATSLHIAALAGHASIVKLLLQYDAASAKLDSMNQNPLHLAAESGDPEVGALLAGCTGLEVEDKNGTTPLLVATKMGHLKFVEVLLKHGADVDSGGSTGRLPLMWAAEAGHADVVKLLLETGATVSLANIDDESPLLSAVRAGHMSVVKVLLEREVGIETRFRGGRTALLWATDDGQLGVVKLLLGLGADIHSRDGHGDNALLLAVRHMHTELVGILLEHPKIFIDSEDPIHGRTALTWAMKLGFPDAAKLLIKHGASVEHKDNRGKTPFKLALKHQQWELVQLMLERGAKIASGEGESVMLLAADKGNIKLACLLLDAGASVDCQGRDYSYRRRTPLILAAGGHHTEMVDLLLSRGANVNARDEEGITPLANLLDGEMSMRQAHRPLGEDERQIAKTLINAGATLPSGEKGSQLLISTIRTRETWLTKRMIEKGCADLDYSSRSDDGKTALDFAGENGDIEILELLFEKGASVSRWTNPGHDNSALAESLRRYNSTTVMFFLKHGAAVPRAFAIERQLGKLAVKEGNLELLRTVVTAEGKFKSGTIGSIKERDLLVHAINSGSILMVQELLKYGADIEEKSDDSFQAPPLFNAIKNPAMLELLLYSGANPEAKDRDGRTALSHAIARGHKEAIKILSEPRTKIRFERISRETKIRAERKAAKKHAIYVPGPISQKET